MHRTPFLLLLLVAALPARSARATVADDICPASADPCVVSTVKGVLPGSTLDFGTRALDVRNHGKLQIASGLMTIRAGSVRVESGGELDGSTTVDTGASITVMTTGDITIETGGNGDGMVDVSADLNPGEIDLLAHGNITIGGSLDSNANNTQGDGGVINVIADGNVSITGPISAKAGTQGLGGAITASAGGSLTAPGTTRADGGDGGDIEFDALNGDINAGGDLNSSAGGTFGDGGTVTLLASRNTTVGGQISLQATGNTIDGGGTGGDADIEGTSGTVTLNGDLDNHGASPDGDAGEVDIVAGLDYVQPSTVMSQGGGSDSCGGLYLAQVGRTFTLTGDIDESGGFCGGDMEADAASVSIGSAAEVNADGGGDAGTVSLFAQQIASSGKLHATATGSGGTAGEVQLAGCTIGVPNGAQINSDGLNGENLIQASGQLTVGGTLSSRPSGHNRFEYGDSNKPPSILGSASISPVQDCAPAKGCLVTLPACGSGAVCGNGTVELGETCDDGNTTPCDGCSATCQVEGCGNGTVECGEECDDGAFNGTPGDPCDATCHAVSAASVIFIPSTHGATGCMLEWALRTSPVTGFPSTSQSCIDGDPACDQDGVTNGVCTLSVSACLNVTDVRLPGCAPRTVDDANVRRPNPVSPQDRTDASNSHQLVTAVEGLGITVRSGSVTYQDGTPTSAHDKCTDTFLVEVPHATGVAGRRLLSVGATASNGDRVSNRLSLTCLPNPAVCGNGVIEVTENCDDGNAVPCDGCSAQCRREICGNGVVDCGEQCDDGPSNGKPGSTCTAQCTAVPPPGRIPGGSNTRDCVAEWALAGQLAVAKNGLPSTKQTCVDNDPSCDFDPTLGNCRFHLWSCVGGDDTRIACAASSVTSLELKRPKATQKGPGGPAHQVLLDAFGRLSLPSSGSGEVCTARADLDVPAGRSKLAVGIEATTDDGRRDRDTLKLTCEKAP